MKRYVISGLIVLGLLVLFSLWEGFIGIALFVFATYMVKEFIYE